jgi:thioredoxin-related protein
MKILLSLFLATSLLTAGPVWLTDFQKAKTEAATSNKNILLNFSGSDWCGPCIRLHKEVFESNAFGQYAKDNLVLVNADFPRLRKNQLPAEVSKQNDLLAEQYNKEGKFPYTILLDANGKILKTWEGYSGISSEKFVTDLNSAIHDSH